MTIKEDYHTVVVRQFGDWVLYLNGDIEYIRQPYSRFVPYSDIKNSKLATEYAVHMERKTWWNAEIGLDLSKICAASWRLKEYLYETR